MALQLSGAATSGLEFTGNPITAFPFSLVLYVASPKTNSNNAGLTLGNSAHAGSYAYNYFDWGNNKSAGYGSAVSGGASAIKTSTPDINNTALQVLVAVFTSASSRTVYFGSNVGVTDTSANTNELASMNRVSIGCLRNNGTLLWPMAGHVAEAHIFNTALTASDAQTLVNAATLPETMAGWVDGWTLKDYQASGNYPSIGGSRTMVALGGVSAGTLSHPIARSASGPTINTQPGNATVTMPSAATFTVSATASGGTLSYQWQRSTNGGSTWANVTTGSGGTTASYTTGATAVTGGTDNNADQYRCAVTDSNGTTNTSAAVLTVNAAAGRLFRQALGGTLTGCGSNGPFYTNPLN